MNSRSNEDRKNYKGHLHSSDYSSKYRHHQHNLHHQRNDSRDGSDYKYYRRTDPDIQHNSSFRKEDNRRTSFLVGNKRYNDRFIRERRNENDKTPYQEDYSSSKISHLINGLIL